METSAMDENVFWDMKIDVLHELREELVKNLHPDRFFAYLRSKRVFDADDCEDIRAERTRRQQAEKFLDVLESKGPDAFDEFCEILRKNKTQLWLLKKIIEKFDEKKCEVIGTNSLSPVSGPFIEPSNMGTPKSLPTVVLPRPTFLPPPGGIIGVQNSLYLPGPGDPGAPIPPDEVSSTAAGTTRCNFSHDEATFSGNSVAQSTSQDANYPGPTPPPYTPEPPQTPPPPYSA